jgi:crossover junction endodeoxyribonuclease RuvC
MTLILGIDPGVNGALAVLDTASSRVTCHDMPGTTEALHDLLAGLPVVKFCVLEQLHAGPQMSRTTIARMFEAYGALKGALAWRSIPTHSVRPSQWKPALSIPADKNAARRRAAEFFPDDAHQWRLAKHDGRAESALLAWFGLRWK